MQEPLAYIQTFRGVIVGAGAQGRVVAAVWQRAHPGGQWIFLDDHPQLQDTQVAGLLVAGGLKAYASFRRSGDCLMIGVGNNFKRTALARQLSPASFATVIDPSAVIMPGVEMGRGVLVGPQAVVHTGAQVGNHVILNTGAIVEHDAVIEEGATLAPGVRMAGRVWIGRHAFLATGVTLAGRIRVGEEAIVGAGAVVVRDVPPGCLAYGTPARVVREATGRDWDRLF
jgi:sugar O-acyltransferase (sialic acid O-acetyltransferase NeuD family)